MNVSVILYVDTDQFVPINVLLTILESKVLITLKVPAPNFIQHNKCMFVGFEIVS